MRTWAALSISSLFGWFLPDATGWGTWLIAAYMAVDALSAGLVLRRPAGLAQKLVGIGFAGMIICHCGFLLSPRVNWDGYAAVQSFVGWAQLASLFVWGAWDGMAALRRWPFRRETDRAARA